MGVDETLFWRKGRWRTKQWCTSVVDVGNRQLIDIVPGRTAESAAGWFRSQPAEWRDGIRWAVLDLSGPYRTAYDRVLPNAAQVADPFHVIRLANQRLDEVRRRVQNETLGHRGRKDDPLYRIRRLLTSASERISDRGRTRLRWPPHSRRPTRRSPHRLARQRNCPGYLRHRQHPNSPPNHILQLADDLQDESCPPEIHKLGRTIARWAPQIAYWHISKVTNGPTEALNNLPNTRQASSVRVPQLRELPNPGTPLRRETQLGPTHHRHSPLKSDEPVFNGPKPRNIRPALTISFAGSNASSLGHRTSA